MSDFQALLRVQEHDTASDQLRHRRATLPELEQLASVEEAVAGVEKALAEVEARRNEAAGTQRRLEDELAAVEAKIADIEKRLYSGQVSVVRELQAMQADAESLRRRRGALEDEVLEAMSVREPLDAEVAALTDDRGQLDSTAGSLRGAIAEAQAGLDAELDVVTRDRAGAAEGLPPDLVDLYEGLRARSGGIGAAAYANGRCGGCHLALPATEVDRLKREPPDVLVQCEQCGRVLVR